MASLVSPSGCSLVICNPLRPRTLIRMAQPWLRMVRPHPSMSSCQPCPRERAVHSCCARQQRVVGICLRAELEEGWNATAGGHLEVRNWRAPHLQRSFTRE